MLCLRAPEGAKMYENYPSTAGGGQVPEPTQRPAPPTSVQTAVRLMYAGAVISAIAAIIEIFALPAVRHAYRVHFPHYTAGQVNSAADRLVVSFVIFNVIAIALWLWLAWACKNGRNWGRITGTVLFGLDTLFTLLQLAAGGLGIVFALVTWLIGLGAIILLWRGSSTAFFKQLTLPQLT
jgi:hypothetical protein